MTRRASRLTGPARWAGAIAVLLLLTGCPASEDGRLASTASDVDRAERAWRDPWLAPQQASVASVGYGSNGLVRREVGVRKTQWAGTAPAAAVRADVEAGLRQGWRLLGAECKPTKVSATLARGRGLERSLVALVVGTRQRDDTDVGVVGIAPHHADGEWPTPDPVQLSQTCLAGGKPVKADVELVNGPPRETADTQEPGARTIGWASSSPSARDRAVARAVAADPWFASTKARLTRPRLAARDERRWAPYAMFEVPAVGAPTDRLREVVDQMQEWVPTWSSCGGAAPAEATLRLDTPEGPAVARVSAGGDANEPVVVTVVLPMTDAPLPAGLTELEPVRSACLAGQSGDGRLRQDGVPAVLPLALQPVPR